MAFRRPATMTTPAFRPQAGFNADYLQLARDGLPSTMLHSALLNQYLEPQEPNQILHQVNPGDYQQQTPPGQQPLNPGQTLKASDYPVGGGRGRQIAPGQNRDPYTGPAAVALAFLEALTGKNSPRDDYQAGLSVGQQMGNYRR